MKIEIELFDDDFEYKGVEIWAYESDGCYYRVHKYDKGFVRLVDAIKFIDEKLGE